MFSIYECFCYLTEILANSQYVCGFQFYSCRTKKNWLLMWYLVSVGVLYVSLSLGAAEVSTLTEVSWFLILVVTHFCISFVYHFVRARQYFLNYYNARVLSIPGATLKDHYSHKEVTKVDFTAQLELFKQELNEINTVRSKSTPTLVAEEQRVETRGAYGPECKVWEVARESALFFGGGRAVFLQLAHPYVASGVFQHSKVADDIQKRFYNTFYHVFRMSFGDIKAAEQSAKQVRFIHDKIVGTLDPSSKYPADSIYSANHQGALIWVWATLVDTSVFMFELTVRRLSDAEKEEFYQQQKLFVRFFGVSEDVLPKYYSDFMEYISTMWNSEILQVSDTARRLEQDLFRPKGVVSSLVNAGARSMSFTLLPPRLTAAFGYQLNNRDYVHLYVFFAVARMVYSNMPGCLRYHTSYIEAEKRIAGRDVFNATLAKTAAWLGNLFMYHVIMDPSQNAVNKWNQSATKQIDSVTTF